MFVEVLVKKLKVLSLLLILLLPACSTVYFKDGGKIYLSDSNETIYFESRVDASSVAEFVRIAQASPKLNKVVLNSNGGDLEAGMDMGDYILSRNLDVEVENKCFSSCANNLFISGNKKIIQDGALVGWHGSAASNFRSSDFKCDKKRCDYQEYIAELVAKYGRSEDYFLNEMNKALAPLRERQQKFYLVRDVDQHITTYGDCYSRNKEVWTYSISDMRKFGVKNIIADEEKYLIVASKSEVADVFEYPAKQSELDCGI